MKLSKEARKVSRELFKLSFTEGRLNEASVRTIAQKISDTKPRHYIEILKNYHRLLRLEVEKMHAVIESAVDLDGAEREKLLSELRAKYGESLTAEFKVAPELIGGLRIKLGSTVWDSSVRGNLNRLENQLAHI
ncbi:MAG: ATP synthase F1 subunit delta [Verrucomicrobiota bacterium]